MEHVPGRDGTVLASMYAMKNDEYFSGARSDIVRRMPNHESARVLEIGCGTGRTGELALKESKAGFYQAVELDEQSANRAKDVLSDVIHGNVEEIDLSRLSGPYDVLIFSEVLEHMVDPWNVLQKIVPLLRPAGLLFASSPNISHYHVVLSLLRGRFDYQASGVMDRTHLRWFTPQSYRSMFEQAGLKTMSVEPLVPFSLKARIINALTLQRFKHLFAVQIMYVGEKT